MLEACVMGGATWILFVVLFLKLFEEKPIWKQIHICPKMTTFKEDAQGKD